MLIVTKIEVLKVDRDPYRIIIENGRSPELYSGVFDDIPPNERFEHYSELIKGREFIIPETKENILIGFSHQAAREIGIHLEVWENMRKTSEKNRADNRWLSRQNELEKKKVKELNEVIKEFKYLGFWSRLKFLFTRKI